MVIVLTHLPLQVLLQRSDYTRKVAKWGTMLGTFDIKYLPQTAVKGQILAHLVAEFTKELGSGDFKRLRRPEEVMGVSSVATQQAWQLFVDGAAN